MRVLLRLVRCDPCGLFFTLVGLTSLFLSLLILCGIVLPCPEDKWAIKFTALFICICHPIVAFGATSIRKGSLLRIPAVLLILSGFSVMNHVLGLSLMSFVLPMVVALPFVGFFGDYSKTMGGESGATLYN